MIELKLKNISNFHFLFELELKMYTFKLITFFLFFILFVNSQVCIVYDYECSVNHTRDLTYL